MATKATMAGHADTEHKANVKEGERQGGYEREIEGRGQEVNIVKASGPQRPAEINPPTPDDVVSVEEPVYETDEQPNTDPVSDVSPLMRFAPQSQQETGLPSQIQRDPVIAEQIETTPIFVPDDGTAVAEDSEGDGEEAPEVVAEATTEESSAEESVETAGSDEPTDEDIANVLSIDPERIKAIAEKYRPHKPVTVNAAHVDQRMELKRGEKVKLTWVDDGGKILAEGTVTEATIQQAGWTMEDFALALLKHIPDQTIIDRFMDRIAAEESTAVEILCACATIIGGDNMEGLVRVESQLDTMAEHTAEEMEKTKGAKVCAGCGRQFPPKRAGQRFCSTPCGKWATGEPVNPNHPDVPLALKKKMEEYQHAAQQHVQVQQQQQANMGPSLVVKPIGH